MQDGAVPLVGPDGGRRADRGDRVIREPGGGIYPCKPDFFATVYKRLA